MFDLVYAYATQDCCKWYDEGKQGSYHIVWFADEEITSSAALVFVPDKGAADIVMYLC